MMNNRDQCCTSPPNSPVNLGTSRKYSTCGASFSACDSPPADVDNTCTVGSLGGSLMGRTVACFRGSILFFLEYHGDRQANLLVAKVNWALQENSSKTSQLQLKPEDTTNITASFFVFKCKFKEN
uniref:Uncharacterized protein n=1 Tax=Setaria digitata TaxID=48799 RepID=A0A915PL15_9BILA